MELFFVIYINDDIIKQTAGTSITLYIGCTLSHDGTNYLGFVSFPFATKNKNYTVQINAAVQENVGDVTGNIAVSLKNNTGFLFAIPGTYDYKKCNVRISYTITFA